jgi:hypothetical protein
VGVRLVDERGQELDLSERLERALDEAGVAGLRTALTEAGVPLRDEAIEGVAAPTGDGNDVIAVWPDLFSRGGLVRYDAFVTRDLLVLVKQRRSWSLGMRRGLAQQFGLGADRIRAAAAERIGEVLSAPMSDICRRPDAYAVRWDDVPSVRFKGGIATAWVLRLPGQPAPLGKLQAENDRLVPSAAETAELLAQLVGDRLDSRV